MEKKEKSCANDSSVIYHIKVLYGVGFFLLIVLLAEIWIYYQRLNSLQLQINRIAVTQTLLRNGRTNYLNSTTFQHDFRSADLEFLFNDISQFRIKRNFGSNGNKYHSNNHVSIFYYLLLLHNKLFWFIYALLYETMLPSHLQ